MGWGEEPWGEFPWGGTEGASPWSGWVESSLPLTSEGPPPSLPFEPLLPVVSFSIDGQPVEVFPGWEATADTNGGYQSASFTIAADDALRLGVSQGARVRVTANGEEIWTGRATVDPAISEGQANLTAQGDMVRAEKSAGNILFQAWGPSRWVDERDEPHGFQINQKVIAEVGKGALIYRTPKGEDYASGQGRGLCIWVPGTQITQVRFDWVGTGGTGNLIGRIQRFSGPSGSKVNSTAFTLADADNVGHTFADPRDGIVIRLETTSNFTVASTNAYRAVNLRVYGVATNDTYRSDQVATHLASLLGYDARNVAQTTDNILPLLWEDGSWAELMDYISILEDHWWGVFGDELWFRPFGERVHRVSGHDAEWDLTPLEVFNRVRVAYTSTAEVPQQRVVDASPDPLAETDMALTAWPNVWEEELEDPQPNSTLATNVASHLIGELSQRRWSGQITVTSPDCYQFRPGDVVEIADWGPGESMQHRIQEVSYSSEGTVLGIESHASAAALIQRWQLRQERKPTNVRKMRRRIKKRRQKRIRKQRRKANR